MSFPLVSFDISPFFTWILERRLEGSSGKSKSIKGNEGKIEDIRDNEYG